MAAITRPMEVIVPGNGWVDYYTYVDAEAITMGDGIRLTSSGTIKLADAASAGAIHGVALETGTTGGDPIKVFMFGTDTRVKIQCYDTVEPEDLTLGVAYTLDVTAGAMSITNTTTNGVAIVMERAGQSQPWTDPTGSFDEAVGTDNNCVVVRFSAATLDTYAAA